jgi:cell division protein FtsB
LLVSIFVAFGYARAYYQDYKIREEISSLEDEFKRLEKNKIGSLELLSYVSGPDFVEEKAREELNLKKPGEKIFIVKREDTSQENNYKSDGSDEKSSNLRKWLNYFLHISVDN